MNKELFDKGMQVRREVVGDHVLDHVRNADDFTMPMQELVTEYCWGTIWSRDELDRRSRSILNLGMLAGANRPDELAAHIRGALKNGVSKVELRECFLQVAIYLGVPAAFGCFRVAKKVFEEDGI